MKVGDYIWHFDTCRRIYPNRVAGTSDAFRAPLYREHWTRVQITGETRVSWITYSGKVPKNRKDLLFKGWAFTQEEVDRDVWIEEMRVPLERALSCCIRRFEPGCYEKMQKLMAAIDFKPEAWKR